MSRDSIRQGMIAEITERLREGQRDDFRQMLATAIAAQPTLKGWEKTAAKSPDRYVQALTQLCRMCGITTEHSETTVTVNIRAQISRLSDSELSLLAQRRLHAMLETPCLPVSSETPEETTESLREEPKKLSRA